MIAIYTIAMYDFLNYVYRVELEELYIIKQVAVILFCIFVAWVLAKLAPR